MYQKDFQIEKGGGNRLQETTLFNDIFSQDVGVVEEWVPCEVLFPCISVYFRVLTLEVPPVDSIYCIRGFPS